MPRIMESTVKKHKKGCEHEQENEWDRGGVEITRNAHMRIEIKHIRHSTYENIFIKTDKSNKRLWKDEGGNGCVLKNVGKILQGYVSIN